MSQGAAIRRRRQAANGYHHLSRLQRPKFAGYSAAKSAKKAARRQELLARGLKV